MSFSIHWKNLKWQILLVRRKKIKNNTRRKLHNKKKGLHAKLSKIYLQTQTKPIYTQIKEKKLTNVEC